MDGARDLSSDELQQLCPDISQYWQLRPTKDVSCSLLQAKGVAISYGLNEQETFALKHFNGKWSKQQLKRRCQRKFLSKLPVNFVEELFSKLIEWEVIELATTAEPQQEGLRLKSCVQSIKHPDNYWILRNPEDVTNMQVCPQGKKIIEGLQKLPPQKLLQTGEFAREDLQEILKQLRVTAMIEGTSPPKAPPQKFHPLKLLFFRLSLFNPDSHLVKPAQALNWLWTKAFFLTLCTFLSWSAVVGLNMRSHILATGQAFLQSYGSTLLLPFGLLTMLVVTLHELGHALTLKHYQGIVPEIGLLFMLLIPAAYTNTTDSYCLVKKRQRLLVVGAGILVQVTIAAIAFWLWQGTVESSWLDTSSYLLLIAALFTIALNLNPLARFDGYHFLVALTGINNLRQRSFDFYRNLLIFNPTGEPGNIKPILAAYAPLSFAYIILVFGRILYLVTTWTLDYFAITALLLLLGWLIYYFFPNSKT
ncbi:MAG: M50 family metallopeptidase [Spirulinaceae cyanobacterium]